MGKSGMGFFRLYTVFALLACGGCEGTFGVTTAGKDAAGDGGLDASADGEAAGEAPGEGGRDAAAEDGDATRPDLPPDLDAATEDAGMDDDGGGTAPAGYAPIPAGTFTMGCSPGDARCCRSSCGWPFDIEKPHQVRITRPFWMKQTEVTQGEWTAATGANPAVFTACGADCPVENVTWWQTAAYCNLLSQREGLEPCYYADAGGGRAYGLEDAGARARPYWVRGLDCEGYRLPTEAEWEYAARAGTTTPLYSGEASDANLGPIGWYGANSACSYAGCEEENCREGAGGIPPSGPHPAGQKQANDWGLHDTSGNIWEFVWDFFGEYHDGPVDDPVGPMASQAGFHVARGGSWLNGVAEARASTRDGDDCTCDPDNGPGCHTGFRTARTTTW